MTTTPARAAGLAAARARDSQDKRQRALTALQALEMGGEAITFPAVAKAAGVSTWLVYAHGVREHIEAARQRHAASALASATTGQAPAASAGLRTDLAVAREQIKDLRAERDKLRSRLRLQLGAEIDGPLRAELIARVADLETVNRQLVAERDVRAADANLERHRARELEDELSAARESLRRMIRSENR
jgi:hypothetical protein